MAHGPLRAFAIAPGEWRPLLVLGFLFTAQVGSLNVRAGLTTAAHSAILLNLYAVHTVVLAHFMIAGDRPPRKLAGILIAYSGIVTLFGHVLGRDGASVLGDLVIFLSGRLLGERTIYLARAVRHVDPLKLLLAQALVGTTLLLVLSPAVEDTPTHPTLRLATGLGHQGVVVAGLNFVANLWLLTYYRAGALAGFFPTPPVFGVAIAALVGSDTLLGRHPKPAIDGHLKTGHRA